MTRVDLDAHGCKLAELWHEAASWRNRQVENAQRNQVLELATSIAGANPVVACYLGARIYDRLRYMGEPGDAQLFLDAIERKAVEVTS